MAQLLCLLYTSATGLRFQKYTMQGWIYWGGTGGMLSPHTLGEVGVQGDWQFLPSPSLDLEKQLQKQKLSSLVSGCPIARYSEYV